MEYNKSLWNEAGKDGLVLGGISLAYMIAVLMLEKIPGQTAMVSILSTILWAVKLWVCLWVLKVFMTRYSRKNPTVDNNGTFRFGMAVAFLSALIYAGGQLAWTTQIQPDMFVNKIAELEDSMESMLTDEMIDMLEAMIPKMPAINFFSSLIWCFLFGTVFSSIYSRNIPSRNPFDNA